VRKQKKGKSRSGKRGSERKGRRGWSKKGRWKEVRKQEEEMEMEGKKKDVVGREENRGGRRGILE
jgi:hypothetical protein